MLFSSIPGHAQLKEHLIEMANANRVGHALLFWGDEGVGALALALALAQQMVCSAKKERLACGTCPKCNKMQKLIHPDLHFAVPVNSVKPSDKNPVTNHYGDVWRKALSDNPYMSEHQWYDALGIDNKSGNISVHEADAILKKLSYKAFEGDCKFMIVWLPERMNVQAANTLLKILEEPSFGTHFFLVSEHPEQLLPTIRSRCQSIRVNPILKEEMVPALAKELNISVEEAEVVARLSGGSWGRARSVSNLSEQQEEVVRYAHALINCCVEKRLFTVIQWSEEAAGFGRERQRQLIQYILELLRNIHIEHLKVHQVSCVPPAEIAQLRLWAARLPNSFFSEAANALNEALADIDRNVNAKMTFFSVALRLFYGCLSN